MAGLCAAARARELGASPAVLEKGSRAGGSMLLSSCVIWRYRSFDEFRAQCPDGEPGLQKLVHERLDEFYGRNMADVDFGEEEFVPLAQVYGRYARVFNERGEAFFEREVSWSELDLVQATARQPGARAWYVLDERALEQRVRERSVREIVATAPTCLDPADLPFPAPDGAVAAVRVAAAITHTIGGIRVDERARVVAADNTPLDGLFAAGADVGGISAGGYASGLASALVLGRVAAESALS